MHPVAWAAWVTMVMVFALATTNPYYLTIVLLSVVLVAVMAPRTVNGVLGVRAMLILGVALFAMSLVIAAINGGIGERELFTLPGPSLPDRIGGLELGGPVTAEALTAAALRGLAILCVLLGFAVFNSVVSPHRLLRLAPATLFHAGLVVTIGLTLLPSTIADVRRIREMRALRGASTGLRSLPAIIVPAVIGGLERSMRLAEAMEARGYAATPPLPRAGRIAGIASVPLMLVAAWGWFIYEPARPLAAIAVLAAIAAVVAWGWSASRQRSTTRLREEPMLPLDMAGVALSAVVGAVALFGRFGGGMDLTYNPFAGFSAPPFTLVAALMALTCAWPAVWLALASPSRATRRVTEPVTGEPVQS